MKKISKQTNFTPNANLTQHKRGVGVQKLQKMRETRTPKDAHKSTCLLMLVSMILFFGCAGMAVMELLK